MKGSFTCSPHPHAQKIFSFIPPAAIHVFRKNALSVPCSDIRAFFLAPTCLSGVLLIGFVEGFKGVFLSSFFGFFSFTGFSLLSTIANLSNHFFQSEFFGISGSFENASHAFQFFFVSDILDRVRKYYSPASSSSFASRSR